MNFGDIWAEHRRFITQVVVGGVAFLIAWLVIDSLTSDSIRSSKSTIARANSDMAAALPPGTDPRRIAADREELQKKFDALVKAVQRKPDAPYVLGANVPEADLHYNAQIDRVRTTVVELAALQNVFVDSRLGLPDTFPGSRAEIEHWLKGLDVVEDVLSACVGATVRHPGGIARVDRIEIAKPVKKEGAAERRRQLINTVKVEFVIVGHPIAIDEVLRGLPVDASDDKDRVGKYLAVEDVTVRSLDLAPGQVMKERGADPKDRQRVECRLTVVALTIDPEGAPPR